MHPALLLVDFGHFQYNSVMLGLFFLSGYFGSTMINRSFDSTDVAKCQLYVQGPGTHSRRFLCGESRVQADGVVLRPSDWLVSARQVYLSRPEEWVSSFSPFLSSPIVSRGVMQGETVCAARYCDRCILHSFVLAISPTFCLPNNHS